MEPGLQCTKIYLFLYPHQTCFKNFVQSVVHDRREGDENPLSAVVAEKVIILGNSLMDIRSWIDSSTQSRNTWTMRKLIKPLKNLYLKDWKQFIKTCMRQSCLNQPLTERTHHCCIFHSAVCKDENVEAILQLDKFYHVNNLEELEMDRDLLS